MAGEVNYIGTFLVALVGGGAAAIIRHVFSFLSKKSDRKVQERDALESLIIESINETRLLAVEYWSSDETNSSRAISYRITAICDELPKFYLQLFENDAVSRELDVILNSLTKAITGGKFQQVGRKKDLSKIAEIEVFTMKLIAKIKTEKARIVYPFF